MYQLLFPSTMWPCPVTVWRRIPLDFPEFQNQSTQFPHVNCRMSKVGIVSGIHEKYASFLANETVKPLGMPGMQPGWEKTNPPGLLALEASRNRVILLSIISLVHPCRTGSLLRCLGHRWGEEISDFGNSEANEIVGNSMKFLTGREWVLQAWQFVLHSFPYR